MDINTAYEFVKDLANKDQKGYLPSIKFNRYAERAQMEVFMIRYGNPHEYQPGRPIPRMAFSTTQKMSDDLRPFLNRSRLNISRYGQCVLPKDYVHPTSIRYKLTSSRGTKEVPIKILSEDKLSYRLASAIVAPSKEYPVCTFYDSFVQFYPENLNTVSFTYLRRPNKPEWAYTILNGREVYDPSNSVDWEFPDDVHNELVMRVLSYLGIRIREAELTQYAELKAGKGI